MRVTVALKNAGTAYLLWAFLGGFGAHKLYLGRPWLALLWACTFGLLLFGTVWDLFTLPSQVRKANQKLIREAKHLSGGEWEGPRSNCRSDDERATDVGRHIDFEKYRTPREHSSRPSPVFGRRTG